MVMILSQVLSCYNIALLTLVIDPRYLHHQKLDRLSVGSLLARVQKTVPDTGLKQFWLTKPCTDHTMPTSEELAILWNYVIFSIQWSPP